MTDRPVVADPALTEINQAFFQWKNPSNLAHIGRREIIIGDARFVGNVGWRQNHQSFDAVAWTNSSLDFADLSYRFVSKVNRINGSVHDMASHLINADLKIGKVGKLGLYGYLLDYTRSQNYGQSRSTFGAEFKGKLESADNMDLLYELEYATQSDYGDNPRTIEADYYFLMIGVATKPVTLKLGYEVLGGHASLDRQQGLVRHPAGHPAQVQRLGRQVPGHSAWRASAISISRPAARSDRSTVWPFTTSSRKMMAVGTWARSSTSSSPTRLPGSRPSA